MEFELLGDKNIHDRVNAKLDLDEKAKEIKDQGKRIMYAKKYKSAYTKINLETITEIEQSPELAADLVTKDKVLEKLDIEKQQLDGVSSGTAWLKKKLRDIFPKYPEKSTSESRRIYLFYCQYIQANLFSTRIKTLEDFKSAMQTFYLSTIKNFIIGLDYTGRLEQELTLQQESINEGAQKAQDYIEALWEKLLKFEDETEQRHELEITTPIFNRDVPISNIIDIHTRFLLDQSTYSDLYNEYRELFKALVDAKGTLSRIRNYHITPLEKIYVQEDRKQQFDDLDRSAYAFEYVCNKLLDGVFGVKFNRLLKSSGEWYAKSNQTSLYVQAKEFSPVSPESVKSIQDTIDRAKDKLIDIYKLKGIFSSGNVDQIRHETDMIVQDRRKQDAGQSTGRVFQSYVNQAYYYREGSTHANVFLTLFPEDYTHVRKGIVKYPTSNEELLHYAKKALEALDKKEADWKKQIDDLKPKLARTEEDWSWSGIKRGGSSGPKSELRVHHQKPLSHIERTNALKIQEFNSNEEIQQFYKDKLGIDNVTYGKYVKDKERQAHAYHLAMSMVDFCEVLGWDIKKFTSQLNLSIAIGAAGGGGASAFYMRAPAAFINITKKRGDGSLAHELFHYVDNFTSKTPSERGVYMATEWNLGSVTSRYVTRPQTTGSYTLNDALFDLYSFVRRGNIPWSIDGDLRSRYSDYKKEALVQMELRGVKNKASQGCVFFRYSSALAEYWTRNREMFARMSECYMFDQLQKRGMFNNYLVSAENFDSEYNIYPMGPEREIINILLEPIFNEIKVYKGLGEFNFDVTERIDNFIALKADDDKSEVEVNEVEFPAEEEDHNLQLIEAGKKLDKLIDMLNQYGDGGPLSRLIALNQKYAKAG